YQVWLGCISVGKVREGTSKTRKTGMRGNRNNNKCKCRPQVPSFRTSAPATFMLFLCHRGMSPRHYGTGLHIPCVDARSDGPLMFVVPRFTDTVYPPLGVP